MKILLIQPHSDDIVLSCFNQILKEENEVTILTIEHSERRHLEDKKLQDFFPNLTIKRGLEFEDFSYKKYYENDSRKKFNPFEAVSLIESELGKENIDKIKNLIDGTIEEGFDEIYTCMGIGHPLHQLVYKLSKGKATHLYRDWPHSYKARNISYYKYQKEELLKVEPELIGDEDFLQLKEQIFCGVYKSQSGLAFYERGHMKKHFQDEIYKVK